MAVTIPFSQETFVPICIKDNDVDPAPVEFDLSAVGGANRARLRSILVASEALDASGRWTPEIQESSIAAFRTGAGVFVDGIDAIRNLYVPAVLAKRLGLIAELPKVQDGETVPAVPVVNGREFSLVCGYWPILTFEVAMAIARLSGQAEIDPRFFVWLSTSLGVATPESLRGTAGSVRRVPKNSGIAGSRTRKGKPAATMS